MTLEIAIAILAIHAMVFFSVCILLLVRALWHFSAEDNEKTPSVLEINRVKRRGRSINRLTNQSKKWLEARGKNGKG